jgi:hypothetical protein
MRGPHLSFQRMSIKVTATSTVRAPVLHVGTAGESMANDHDIIVGIIQHTPCLVRYWHILELSTAFEGEGWDNVYELVNFRRHNRDREIFIVVKNSSLAYLTYLMLYTGRTHAMGVSDYLVRSEQGHHIIICLTPTRATRSMHGYDLHFHSADVQD